MDHSSFQIKPRGQSLVEFALSLTILLFLVVGVVDVSRALFTYLSMREAAQEGALFATFDPTNTAEIVDRTCQASSILENLDCGTSAIDIDISVNLSGDACMSTSGAQNRVEVVVDYPHFPLTMPLIGELVGADADYTIPISASVSDNIISPICP